jgi:endonuclease-8
VPEGDTIHRAATVLGRALSGRTVTRLDTSDPELAQADRLAPVTGRRVHAVWARGKHLLMLFRNGSGDPAEQGADRPPQLEEEDLVLHSHMGMTGSWHVYRPGERWRKPARLSRVTLHTDAFVVPCFQPSLVELLSGPAAAGHPRLRALGPDAMDADFDASEARRRLRALAAEPIGVALIDQRVLAGVGNVFKSEILFLERVSPFVPVGSLPDAVLDSLLVRAHELLRLNRRTSRRTRFKLDGSSPVWVYGRVARPCLACGTPVRMRRQGLAGRSTYYCPRCQATDPGGTPQP